MLYGSTTAVATCGQHQTLQTGSIHSLICIKTTSTVIYTNIKRFGVRQTFKARSCEGDLALLSIIHRKALQHEASKAGPSATAASVVHTEALQASSGSPLTNKLSCSRGHRTQLGAQPTILTIRTKTPVMRDKKSEPIVQYRNRCSCQPTS